MKLLKDSTRSFKLTHRQELKQEEKTQKIKLSNLPRALSKLDKAIVLIMFLIIATATGWLAWGFYWRHVDINPNYGGVYTEGTVGEPQYINPLFAQSNEVDADLTRLVFSGLLKYDHQQQLVPDLAENYEVSPDEKNYTFHLRKNVQWHDGETLTADDVVFTVQTIKNPNYQSILLANFQDVAVEKIDDYTIKFTLTGESLSPFLKENTTFGILPEHLWQTVTPKNVLLSEYNLEPIGTGPYKFSAYQKDKKTGIISSYTLVRNDNFYTGKPYLEKISLQFFDDYPQLVEAYKAGEIQGISYLPPEEKNNIPEKIQKKSTIYNLKLPRYYALFFNQPKNKALQDKEVRKALAYATDRPAIINDIFKGQGITIDSPILASFLGHNPQIKKYEYNQEKAQEILQAAGWEKTEGNGGRTKNEQKLEFTITTTDQEEFVKLATLLGEQWKAIGATVNVETIDPTTLQTEYIKPRNYEILLYGQLIGHDPDPYPFWHSTQRIDPGLNLTSFKDPSADDLLETARKTSNETERIKKYLHWQNIIAEEVPAILLASPTYAYLLDKDIRGVQLEYITTPSDRFSAANSWFIKVNRGWR